MKPNKSLAREASVISNKIEPMLAGLDPRVQGAVLADLLATWLAGFPRHGRELMLQAHLEGMRPLIEVNEKIRFGEAGHPYNQGEH